MASPVLSFRVEEAQVEQLDQLSQATDRDRQYHLKRALARLIETLEQVETFTGLGRPSQTPDVRELLFSKFPFNAPYRLAFGQVQVLRFLHRSNERPQDW